MPTLAFLVREETGNILFDSCSMYTSNSLKKYGTDFSIVKSSLFCLGSWKILSNFWQVIVEIFTVMLVQI